MPAPKGNSNASITDGTVPYTPNPRVRCLPEQVDIIRDLSPADRGKAMAKFEDLNVKLGQALLLIVTYAPKTDYIKSFVAECDELLG